MSVFSSFKCKNQKKPMRKSVVFSSLIVLAFASCEKPNVTVNTGQPTPPYLVSGVHDISIINGSSISMNMPITVQYSDSAQESVALSLSALPNGIVMDTTIITQGVPTFSTNFIFYDTTQAGATVGVFPMTLTATGSKTGARIFNFNMRIMPQPSYTANMFGPYHLCSNYCASGNYTDSVYNDASMINKIWFNNFGNYGINIYGKVNSSFTITIPSQTVNGYTVSGYGYLSSSSSYYLYFSNIQVIHNSASNSCSVNMYH